VNVHLDRQLLDRALANLLTNAITATASGNAVTLSSKADNVHGISIVVEDSGCGIPEADLGHVFDRFSARPFAEQEKWRVGAGAAIARDLVQIEGGRLEIASTVGVGTHVTISYPRSVIVRQEAVLAS